MTNMSNCISNIINAFGPSMKGDVNLEVNIGILEAPPVIEPMSNILSTASPRARRHRPTALAKKPITSTRFFRRMVLVPLLVPWV